MVISDLSYVEEIDPAQDISGGGKFFNLNISTIVQVAVPVAIAVGIGGGPVKAAADAANRLNFRQRIRA